jgi:hypothetical protein
MKPRDIAPTDLHPTRRSVVQGLGLMMLAPGIASAGASATVPPVAAEVGPQGAAAIGHASTSSRAWSESMLHDFMRMRGAPDGSRVIWVYSGVLVVKPEARLAQALTRIEGVSYTSVSLQDDGSWALQLEEIGYFCDLETGAVLEQLFNPFTGAQVRPRHYRSPQQLRFSNRQVTPAMQLPPGIDYRGEMTRLATVGDMLAMTEDLYVRVPAAEATSARPASPERISTSLATFTSRVSDLQLPASHWIDCTFTYTTLNSFVGWLGMDSMPGVQNMRLIGAKCRADDHDVVPAGLRARIEADHPGFLIS